MQVKLLLFAILRDIVGKPELEINLPEGSRAVELWEMLREEHLELSTHTRPPMTAINEEYVPPETSLKDGDEVAFIPPVSGG